MKGVKSIAMLKKILDIINQTKRWGKNTKIFYPGADARSKQEFKDAFIKLKGVLEGFAKKHGAVDIITTMRERGFKPYAIIESPEKFGVEAAKNIESIRKAMAGDGEEAGIFQGDSVIAFYNDETKEIKIMGQGGLETGVDGVGATEQGQAVIDEVINPMIDDGIDLAAIAESKIGAALVGAGPAIITEEPGKKTIRFKITDTALMEKTMQEFAKQNQIKI
jgi:hypothetical protein